jgi:bacillithiol biosynthesis deacetylase BshB1
LIMQLDILAIGAHPDDVELFAGGTLAKMASRGYATGIVDMTRGELGSRGTPTRRAREAREAAAVLGVNVRDNMRLTDGEVTSNPRDRLKVIRAIRKYRPTVILTHYWDDKHPDHIGTSRLVSEAAHHAGLAQIKTGQERFRPKALLYFKLPPHIIPTFVVDVSDAAGQRSKAIQAYRSQLFDSSSTEPATYLSQPDFLTHIENIASYYGSLIGTAKGEGFHFKGVPEISDPVDFFKNQSAIRMR